MSTKPIPLWDGPFSAEAAILGLEKTPSGGARSVIWDREARVWEPSSVTIDKFLTMPSASELDLKVAGVPRDSWFVAGSLAG